MNGNGKSAWFLAAIIVVVADGFGLGTPVRGEDPPEKKLPEYATVTKGATKLEGLFDLYYDEKDQKLFLELGGNKYEKEYIFPIAIARGTGRAMLGGGTLNFGDQWVLSFRRVADRVLVVRRNVYFKAAGGSPQADAVRVSYTDSIIASLPIKAERNDPGGPFVLVDLADLLMTDLPNLGMTPDRARSTWAKVKAFPENIEIEVSAVAPMRGGAFSADPAVPDPRGAQVVVHYGLSALPAESSYKPRMADDRVGHFLSVVKDFSNDLDRTAFQRYVTRWKLEKSDEAAEKSPPKEPIIFWIEKTVPREYRPYVKAGILEWNKAFEKIGFLDAIQVRDQQSGDEFDPEDIRYNTFRWITTSAAFAMGPSRTNPKTGQILDADIIFDESMVRYWRADYLETIGIPQGLELLARGQRQAWLKLHAADVPLLAQAEPQMSQMVERARVQLAALDAEPGRSLEDAVAREWRRDRVCADGCMLGTGISRQMGLLAAVMQSQGKADGGKVPREYVGQAIKEVVMHEVGHTLGLRHNFKASTMLGLKETSNTEVTQARGMSGSVMDYLPANFALKGEKQGDYFSTTIGPYDYWVIEYAYSPLKGDEAAELAKIAAKLAEPGHDYGTDEDLSANPDPRINAYDLGDPLEFAQQRARFVADNLDGLAEKVVAEGEGWQRARIAFGHLLGELSSATYLAVQYIGAEYSHRDHRGDPNARLPFEPIPAEKQRAALRFAEEHVLADKAFDFPPDLLNRLAPEQFSHWGQYSFGREPVRLLDQILAIQRLVLGRFLDGEVLAKVQNAELHVPKDTDQVRMPEIFESLTGSVWSELPEGDKRPKKGDKIAISTVRRNLQREHVRRLARLTLGTRAGNSFLDSDAPAPADARSLARTHLKEIQTRVARVLENKGAEPDAYSKAHLAEISDQIEKVLAASLQVNEP